MRAALALAFVTLAPLAACAAAEHGRIHAPPATEDEVHAARGTAAVPKVQFDQPFALAYGRRAQVAHSRVRVRFAALLEDSRCPLGAHCIQAGRARVRLEVRRGRGEPLSIELATDPDRHLASAGGVTWELQGVSPSPVVGEGQRPAADYVLTLVARPLR